MYDLPAQSMMIHAKNPSDAPVSVENLPIARLTDELTNASLSRSGDAVHDALMFYFSNHIRFLANQHFHPLKPLPRQAHELLTELTQQSATISRRIFFHTIAIAMHQVHNYFPGPEDKFLDHLSSRYSPEHANFLKKRLGSGRICEVTKLPGTIGDFSGMMLAIFTLAKWPNWAGGKTWAPIAALTHQCVQGAISPSELTDQAFSLQHHNGSIFNKGQFYGQPDEDKLFHILDVQDAGQIPQWLCQSKNAPSTLKPIIDRAKTLFPEIDQKPDTTKIDQSEKKRLTQQKQTKANNQAAAAALAGTPPPLSKAAQVLQKQNNILMPGVKPQKF